MACELPTVNRQAVFNGPFAYVQTDIMVTSSSEFMIEFWFRIIDVLVEDNTKFVLFELSQILDDGTTEDSVSVYIDEDGLLKCAPFGRDRDDYLILTYDDIRPKDFG